jgi:hypothetical protein
VDTGDGGFAVALTNQQIAHQPATAASAAERTATVTLSHRSRTHVEGFLLRAVDAKTLDEEGTFTKLAPSTMLYEGCARPAAAVCQNGKGKNGGGGGDDDEDEDGVTLPMMLQVAWPADKELRVMFWAVDSEHRYYLAQAGSGDIAAAVAEVSELDPRLVVCPREALPPAVVGTSLAGFALVVLLGAIPAVRLNPKLMRVVVKRRELGDLLPALNMRYGIGGLTMGQLGVAGIWLASQLGALGIGMRDVRGFPVQATFGRSLGKLAGGGFMVLLLPVSRASFWPKVVGLSYERALLWHRWASTFTLAVTTGHGALMVNDYGLHESFSAAANCFGYGNVYGTLIFAAGGLLFVFSQAPVRRLSYRTFSMAHKVLVPAVLVLACVHVSKLIYFLLPSVALEVACNRIARQMQYKKVVRTTSARVIAGGVVELRLNAPHVTAEIARRGASGMGSWVWLAVSGVKADMLNPHPFSVAAVDPGADELKLLIKIGAAGSWTAALAKAVQTGGTAHPWVVPPETAHPGETAQATRHIAEEPAGGPRVGAGLASPQQQALEFKLFGPYGKPLALQLGPP